MTFGAMIKIMNNAKVFGAKREDIAANLLKASGIITGPDGIEPTTITTWIDKKVPNNIINYYPDGAVNAKEVVKFFKRWLSSGYKWRTLRDEFSMAKKYNREDCIVDCNTYDEDEFYKSLLLQFTESLGLPVFDVNDNDDEDKSTDSKERSLSEKMCIKFVEIINAYGVMEIINRKPVVFYRVDSARLRLSHEMIMRQIVNPNREKCGDMALYVNIASFSTKLKLKAMSINANLNNRFDRDDESAFINLEDDSDNEQIKSNLPEILTIPEVLNRIFEESDDNEDEDCSDESDIDQQDVLDLVDKMITGWGDFRSEMNVLYNEIKRSCYIAPTSN